MTSVKSKLFAVKKTRRIGVDAARWSWQTMGETTAEGRLYNRSPRLACLPGASCIMRDLPPKGGCINYLQAEE